MRIIAVSDVHSNFDIVVPLGDVLVVAGDLCDNQTEQFAKADAWLATQPHPYKLFVAGNHDSFVVRDQGLLPSVTRLVDEAIEIGGLRFYGVPWRRRGGAAPDEHVPAGVDVLISHEPPYGIRDWAPRLQNRIGSDFLLRQVEAVKPRLHLFGHAHVGYGYEKRGETLFCNVAICGTPHNYYAAGHLATIVDIDADRIAVSY